MGRAGTDEEFRDFVAARSASPMRLAWLLAPDASAADDLLQTALLRSYLRWRHIHHDPEAYVRRVLVTVAADERRRPWRRETSVDAVPERVVDADPTGAVDEAQRLRQALVGLPARQRAAVVLRYREGLSAAQTAELLGCSEGTARSQATRGLDKLRAALADPVASTVADTVETPWPTPWQTPWPTPWQTPRRARDDRRPLGTPRPAGRDRTAAGLGFCRPDAGAWAAGPPPATYGTCARICRHGDRDRGRLARPRWSASGHRRGTGGPDDDHGRTADSARRLRPGTGGGGGARRRRVGAAVGRNIERVALDSRHCSGLRWTDRPGQCQRWTSTEFVDFTRAMADAVSLVLVTTDEGESLAQGALPVRDMVFAQVDGIEVVGDSARVGVHLFAPKECGAAVYRLARDDVGWHVTRATPADIIC